MPTRVLSRHAVLAVLVASCGFAPQASADGGADERGARALFDEGRLLAKSGRFAEACRKFERSLALDRGLGTEFNLADCWEHDGEKDKARALFGEVADKAHAVGQEARATLARARADALAVKPPAPSPVVATVPTVTISGRDDHANVPRDDESAIDVASSQLRDEYGTLAGATVSLEDLARRASEIGHLAPRDARAQRLNGKIACLKRELDDTWKLAGRVATQIATRAQHVPKDLPRSASDTKIVAAPSPAVATSGVIASVPRVDR